jgi:hypothetical protein
VSDGGQEALIAYRIARAEESLDEARLLLSAGHLNTAVNRLYYACFYAVSALLMSEGHGSSRHSGVRSLFDAHWVKPGKVPIAQGRFYRGLFNNRQKSDYADLVVFAETDVRTWLTQAEAFVALVARLAQPQPHPT